MTKKSPAQTMAKLPAKEHSKVTARKAMYSHKPSIQYFESSRHLESVQRLIQERRQERLERLERRMFERQDREQERQIAEIAHAFGFNADGTELEE